MKNFLLLFAVLLCLPNGVSAQDLNCQSHQSTFWIDTVSSPRHFLALRVYAGKIQPDTLLRFPKSQPYSFLQMACNDSMFSILSLYGKEVLLSVYEETKPGVWNRAGGALFAMPDTDIRIDSTIHRYADFKLLGLNMLSFTVMKKPAHANGPSEIWDHTVEVLIHTKKMEKLLYRESKKRN